jgi:hypothetical protein
MWFRITDEQEKFSATCELSNASTSGYIEKSASQKQIELATLHTGAELNEATLMHRHTVRKKIY